MMNERARRAWSSRGLWPVAVAAALPLLLVGLAQPVQAAAPSTDPITPTCVVEGPEILQASLQECGTLAAGAPGAPQNVRARITGPDVIKVRWQPPSGRKAKLYSVYAFSAGEGFLVCTVKRLRCSATALDVDANYQFYVVAKNKSGESVAASSPEIYLPADASPDGYR